MIQFYSPDVLSTGLLSETESGHCCRVLRLKKDDTICVTDGKGNRFDCRIIDDNPKRTKVEIINSVSISKIRDYQLSICIAPTKNIDRVEWFVEKAVEIGIDSIDFVTCQHSERKIIKPERIEKIIISALKQSLDAYLPSLRYFSSIQEYLKAINKNDLNFVGYCAPEIPKKCFVKEIIPGRNISVLIGPEGDFSASEISACMDAGIIPVTFGDKRLRTETAALYAVTAVNVVNVRM